MVDTNLPPVPIPSPLPPPPVTPVSSFSWIKTLLVAIFTLAGLTGVYFALRQSLPSLIPNTSPSPTSSLIPTPSLIPPTTLLDPIPDATSQLAYLKDINNDSFGEEEVWLINPRDSTEQKLSLTKVAHVYKHYGSPLLFYFQANEQGEYHVLDLSSGIDTTFDLIDHPDPTANIMLNISDINQISPDGKYLVFYAGFTTPCPSPSPFPSGFQGGFGPCEPEISLTTPPGYYYYDFASRQATHFGGTIRIPRWDTQGSRLFVVDYDNGNNTLAINLTSKTSSYVDSTPYFGYFLYPLLRSSQLVKLEGDTGNDGKPPFSKIYLANNQGVLVKSIDSSDSWTGIQPFISVSPDENSILYQRTINIDGLHRDSIYLFDQKTGQSKKLTKDDDNLSYSIYVSWLDNENIVTRVDPIETDHYNSSNQYLVQINLRTGNETRLTSHNQVRIFNSQ